MHGTTFFSSIEELIAYADKHPPHAELAKKPFIEAIWPWVGAARARLKNINLDLSCVEPCVLSQLENYLVGRWIDLCTPSIFLELQASKLRKQLEGSSAKARYTDFIAQRFGTPEALKAFFQEYEELGRRVCVFLDLWVGFVSELLERLAQDSPLLSDTFNGGTSIGKLRSVQNSLGDSHQGGKSVSLLEFESGKKLLYKPKDLRIVSAFHAFLEELNQLGLSPQLKGYLVLPREGYGWEECVENSDCADSAAVSRYFIRGGMLLCLIYLLDGTDIHKENLIASGEFPILVDLETLFHSEVVPPQFYEASYAENFVFKTGMLPSYVFGLANKPGIDMSALGSERGETIPSPEVRWKKLGTDEMFHEKKFIHSRDYLQRVLCKGKKISSKEYVEQIVEGFNTMYAFISQHRGYLLRENSPFAQMAECPVRTLVRPTMFYAALLERLSEPQYLLNPSKIDQELKLLSRMVIEKEEESYLLPIIEEEKKALLNGDVPFFTALPSKKRIFAHGKILAKGVLKTISHDRVRSRIMNLNNADCKLQERYIRTAFFTKNGSTRTQDTKFAPSSPEKRMHAVVCIADELKKRAFSSKNGSLRWVELEPNPLTKQYALGPISDNLYGGRMGMALFFAALFHCNGDPERRKDALNCMNELRYRIGKDQGTRLIDFIGIGGFAGIGGVIYGLVQCAHLLHEDALIEDAQKLAAVIEDGHIREDQNYDLTGGSAGLLLGLLKLHSVSPHPALLRLASLCGDHLIANMKRMETRNKSRDRLARFSQGAPGVAYALLKLARYKRSGSRLDAARSAHLIKMVEGAIPTLDECLSKTKKEFFVPSLMQGAAGIGYALLHHQDQKDSLPRVWLLS